MADVHKLPAADTFTVEQALQSAISDHVELAEVLIVGNSKDGSFYVRSSKMSRRDALWLSEQLRIYALGLV